MHKLFEIPSITLFLCAFCAFLWLYLLILAYLSSRSVKICVNPWLINDLHAFGISTTVERALQIRLFMQNKANFRKVKLNVNKVITVDYEKRTLGQHGKNKANTKPIQTQYKANTIPIRTQYEPKQTQFQAGSRRRFCKKTKDLLK